MSQRVRAHFVPVGQVALELLEATSPESAIAKYTDKRGPGLHHITLARRRHRRGAGAAEGSGCPAHRRAAQARRRRRAGGVHSSVERARRARRAEAGARRARLRLRTPGSSRLRSSVSRSAIWSSSPCRTASFASTAGRCSASCHGRCGQPRSTPDDRNRIPLAMRPLVVRGVRTMLIDAGVGRQGGREVSGDLRGRTDPPPRSLAGRGRALARGHRHRARDAPAFRSCRRIHRARRDGDASDRGFRARDTSSGAASGKTRRTRTSATARAIWRTTSCRWPTPACWSSSSDDQTIMPGVRVRRTGGHTAHHQIALIESGGRQAAYVGDLMPTTAHLPAAWIMGFDLFPMDTLAAKKAFVQEAESRRTLVFFAHDPAVAAGYLTQVDWEDPARAGAGLTAQRRSKRHHDCAHRHHRRQRPVRHGGADRPRRADDSHAVRRSVRARTSSGRCGARAWRFSRVTASATGSCRPS